MSQSLVFRSGFLEASQVDDVISIKMTNTKNMLLSVVVGQRIYIKSIGAFEGGRLVEELVVSSLDPTDGQVVCHAPIPNQFKKVRFADIYMDATSCLEGIKLDCQISIEGLNDQILKQKAVLNRAEYLIAEYKIVDLKA